MTIALALTVVIMALGILWFGVQCWRCPAQDADLLQSRIDRLHEENQALLKLEHKYIHEAYNQQEINARRNDRNHCLSMALAECVKALREIQELPQFGTPSWKFKDLAEAALNRLQIPDDQLPTQGYPDEADDG